MLANQTGRQQQQQQQQQQKKKKNKKKKNDRKRSHGSELRVLDYSGPNTASQN